MWNSSTQPFVALKLRQVTCVAEVWRRHESNYNAYPTFNTPSPYKARRGVRREYEYKLYKGGDEMCCIFMFMFVLTDDADTG